MATITKFEKPQESSTESPEVEPKPRGRTSTLPKPSSKTLIPQDFYAYTQGLSAQDWAHTLIYVFRQYPRIIREPKNIEKISAPISEDYILNNHGSGTYWLMLNDTDTDKTVCQTYPDIDSPNYPPKIDLRELDVAHERNKTYVDHLKRTGKLTADGDIAQSGKSDNGGEAQAIKEIALEAMRAGRNQPGMETRAFEKMMDMMSTASQKSIEIAMGQVKKEDPTAFLQLVMQMSAQQNTTMAPMMTMLTGLMTKMFERDSKPQAADPMVTVLMEQLKTAREEAAAARLASEAALQRAHEKEMAMLENRAEAVDPMAMVEKVLNLQEKLGGGGPKDWKAQLVDQGMQHMPEVLSLAGRFIGYRAQPAQQAQQPAAQRPAQQPQPQQPQTQPQPTGASVKTPPISTDPEIEWLYTIFLAQGPLFINAFRTNPANGEGLAMALDDMGLKPLYTRASKMGPAKIIETMKLIPQMWADAMAVGGEGSEGMVMEFVKDFCDGPQDDDEDEDEDPPIPETVTPVTTLKKKGGKK
jgi:hypothetical protein